MQKILKLSIMLILSLLLVPVIGACSSGQTSSSTTSALDTASVLAYADPATETTLQGLSENNLEKFVQYGNEKFKAAVTAEVLDKTAISLNGKLGTYQSKTFVKIEEDKGYILVHYKAKYTRGEIGVRMVFDQDHLVAGQWFE